MRITFVTPVPIMAGGIRVIAIYAQQLRKRGHEVNVVAPLASPLSKRARLRMLLQGRRWPRYEPRPQNHFQLMGVPVSYLDRPGPVTGADVPDADVVIGCLWSAANWVSAFGPSKGAKVHFIQGYESHPQGDNAPLEAAWRLPMHKLVISQWLADLARERFGDPDVSVVRNSVNTRQFQAPPRAKRPELAVGFVYSDAWSKAAEVAVEACRLASQRIPALHVRVFGHAPLPAQVKLPANSEYVVNPPQETLSHLYASCDAWLWSSRQEGFGLPILEAMACRTPVIATRAGAAPELLDEGRGLLVDCDNPEAMAEAIAQVHALSGPDWKALSDRAYAYVHGYRWEDAAGLFERVLERVSAAHRQSRMDGKE